MNRYITGILCIAAWIFSTSRLSAQGYEWKTIYTFDSVYAIHIDCIDSLNCVAATLQSFRFTQVSRTTDGGLTWNVGWHRLTSKVDGDYLAFRGLAYPDANTVVVCADSGIIFHTSDAGVTWQRKLIAGDSLGWLTHLSMKGKSGSVVSQGLNRHPDTVYITSDGGSTWKPLNLPRPPGWTRSEIDGSTCTGPDTYFCYLQSDTVHLAMLTTDAGRTWNVDATTIPWRAADYYLNMNFSFPDIRHGWLTGTYRKKGPSGQTQFRSVIFATTDGGRSWQNQLDEEFQSRDSVLFGARLYDIAFRDSLNGLATGPFLVLRTTDGGGHWVREVDSLPFYYYTSKLTVAYKQGMNGLLIGDGGRRIVRAVPVQTGVRVPDRMYGSFRISPNPASGSVSLQSTEGTVITGAELYNGLGDRVLRVSGRNAERIAFDVTELPSGLYRCIIVLSGGHRCSVPVVIEK